MIGITDFEKSEHINMVITKMPHYNRMWGSEYLLMDSSTFMGITGNSRYDKIIEIYANIWDLQSPTAP